MQNELNLTNTLINFNKFTKSNNLITIYPLDVDKYNEALEREVRDELRQIEFLRKRGWIIYKRTENKNV